MVINKNNKNLPIVANRKTLRRKPMNESVYNDNYMQLLPESILYIYENRPDELLWDKFPEFVNYAYMHKKELISHYDFLRKDGIGHAEAIMQVTEATFADWAYVDYEMTDEYDCDLYSRIVAYPEVELDGECTAADFLWRVTINFIITGKMNESRKVLRRKPMNESRVNRSHKNRKSLNEAAKVKQVKIAAYNKIMKDIVPLIQESLNDQEVNELFGFGGKSIEKPSQELSATYIKEASNEDLANAMAEHMNYWMSKAGDNVDKAIMTSANQIHELCQSGKENCQKVFMGIVGAVKSGLSSGGDKSKSVGRSILLGCAICVKMVANGIEMAKNALSAIYKHTSEFLTKTYDACKAGIEKGIDNIKEKAELLGKVSVAALTLVGNKCVGAADALGKWCKQIFDDVKGEVKMAALLVRTWFDVKIDAVKEFITSTGKDIKNACVNVYNKIDKNVRKAWKKLSDTIISWINNVRMTLSKLGEKISDTVTKTGDAIIAGKDKAILAGVNKAVKMLSKNYSEDDVVAIVRKAYNEGLTFDAQGRCLINESYYMNTRLQLV